MSESVSFKSLPAVEGFRPPEADVIRGPVQGKDAHGYSEAIALKICERIMNGETLRKITDDPRMPHKATILRWLNDPRLSGFREHYYNARRVFCEIIMDEVIELADDISEDWVETYNKKGEPNGWKPNHESVQSRKLRIDTRKWLASKLIPRVYGEKLEVEHGVTGDLADLLRESSNHDSGLPPPIIDAEIIDE